MEDTCCSVLELRQYTLHPGKRDVLVELFDREFVESQEALGMHLVGQFRDADHPDRFVWLRGFQDMERRRSALTAFYGGPVWKAHRAEANATMVDASDVLLLRPVAPDAGFHPASSPRPPVGDGAHPSSRVTATLYHLPTPVEEGFLHFFERQVRPLLLETGAPPLACFQSEPAENTFPALPVREGENVFVWFASFASEAARADHLERLLHSSRWHLQVLPELMAWLQSPPRQLTLLPTARSQLR